MTEQEYEAVLSAIAVLTEKEQLNSEEERALERMITAVMAYENDWNEERIDIIGANGNEGTHYTNEQKK